MLEKINNFMPLITAIVAILAPVLTAIINNRHQYRIKKMELEQKAYEQSVLHKREIFEKFLSSFNKACQLKTSESLSEFSSCYSLVYMIDSPYKSYLFDIDRKTISNIHISIRNSCLSE